MKRILSLVIAMLMLFAVCASAEGYTIGYSLKTITNDDFQLALHNAVKDAVEASMLILEMTAYYKKNNMTLIDALNKLYETYGFYGERTIDIYMEGLDGIEKRKRVMQSLRESTPEQFGGVKVTQARDYKAGEIKNVYDGTVAPTGLQPSDVLYYVLENGDKIVVRPSGTEPKIKIYLLAHADGREALDAKIEAYASDAKSVAEV